MFVTKTSTTKTSTATVEAGLRITKAKDASAAKALAQQRTRSALQQRAERIRVGVTQYTTRHQDTSPVVDVTDPTHTCITYEDVMTHLNTHLHDRVDTLNEATEFGATEVDREKVARYLLAGLARTTGEELRTETNFGPDAQTCYSHADKHMTTIIERYIDSVTILDGDDFNPVAVTTILAVRHAFTELDEWIKCQDMIRKAATFDRAALFAPTD